jgi:leukotriene-A4 hydrolase
LAEEANGVGWTVFLERKITGRMHGEEFAEFGAILGWKALKDSVNQYGDDKHGFTQLVPPLEGHDPDDAFSSIPYVTHPKDAYLMIGKRIQFVV